jgi:hypothetical protein
MEKGPAGGAGHRSGQVRELIGLSSSLVRPGSGRERERPASSVSVVTSRPRETKSAVRPPGSIHGFIALPPAVARARREKKGNTTRAR